MALIVFSKQVEDDLRKTDRMIVKRISEKLKKLSLEKDILRSSKRLEGEFDGLYRFRIGNFRVIFEYIKLEDKEILYISRIKHRKDVYR